MGEQYLTMAEIEARYQNEWVLIDRPTNDRRTNALTGGVVVVRTPDRAAIDKRLLSLRGGELPIFAIRYVGRMPAPEDPNDLFWFKHAQ